GARAVLFFLVQRADCRAVAVAADIDPHYAARLRNALTAGVEAISYCCKVTTEGIELDRTLPIRPSAAL
ncbi:MAG TPA: DNA/RNA nuclease SfsA, partial [Kiloniellaceae bacterium]|nr:DNA/RNA nuclease SfsA [Kiloniellaceae bacterium]